MRHLILILVILASLVDINNSLFWRRKPKYRCSVPRPFSKPFYFGKTNIWCMSLFPKRVSKRSAPKRNPFGISHRWIWYDGHYLEFGTRPHAGIVIRTTHPMVGDFCPIKRERKPAGYSVLPVGCITSCAWNYEKMYGKFHKMKNNCHMFTNRMADILCNYDVCPEWCNFYG